MADQGSREQTSVGVRARSGGTLFARARARAPLTPGERALLRLIEGLACAALVAALPVVAGALGHGPVRWDDVGRAALAAAAVAVLLALAKYARAQGDPALGMVIEEIAGAPAQPRRASSSAPMSDVTGDDGVPPATADVSARTVAGAGAGATG